MFGYDTTAEPSLAELGRRGFSPEYVFRETKHSVASATARRRSTPASASTCPAARRDDPETVYRATLKAFEAGAHGIVVSREYEEMKVANLRAVGRAFREVTRGALLVLCVAVWPLGSAVLRAQTNAQAPATQALPLTTIEVTGVERYTVDEVTRLSGLRIGQMVTAAEVQTIATRMATSGLFASIRFRYATWPDHLDVTFEVAEAKWTVPVVFDNFIWFTDQELVAAVKLEVPSFDGTAPDTAGVPPLIQHALQGVLDRRGIQGQVGYIAAQALGGGKPEHLFTVKAPGLKTCALRFDGASEPLARELQAASASLVGADYSRHRIRSYARATLARLYRQRGYWRASIGDPLAALGAGCSGVSVTLPVQEGLSYIWDRADWRGNLGMTAAELDALLGIKPGDVADLLRIEDGLRRINGAHVKIGYLLGKARPDPILDDTTRRAVFQITLDEGPQFRMGTMTVTGLAAKDAESLRNRWRLKSGDIYDGSYLATFNAREALKFKGSFKAVVPEVRLDVPAAESPT